MSNIPTNGYTTPRSISPPGTPPAPARRLGNNGQQHQQFQGEIPPPPALVRQHAVQGNSGRNEGGPTNMAILNSPRDPEQHNSGSTNTGGIFNTIVKSLPFSGGKRRHRRSSRLSVKKGGMKKRRRTHYGGQKRRKSKTHNRRRRMH